MPKESEPATTTKTFHQVIVDFELALINGEAQEHLEVTLTALDQFDKSLEGVSLAEKGYSRSSREHWYTRFASALTRYITDPETSITLSGLEKVCRRKQTIAYIFNASGYRNMGHLLSLMSDRSEEGTKLKSKRAAVLFAFCGLDDLSDELLNLALQQPPEVLIVLMLGWLNQRAVLTERGDANRSKLLVSGHLIENAEISDAHVPQVVNAWMYSSYASEPRKHEIKRSFGKLMRRLLDRPGVYAPELTAPARSKPRILVIHERFRNAHAMYRCYAPFLNALGQYFELVALAESEQIDEASDSLFTEVVKLPNGRKSVRDIARTVRTLEPDMIYYPSLGMSHWTVLLAQWRLAPIQFMTHGHPATSMSPVIDYAYTCDLQGDVASLNSERLLMGDDKSVFAPHAELPATLPELVSPSDREVRVAVNSKVMKLSSRLLTICRRLQQNSRVPVRFSFYPGERSVFFDGLAAAIQAQLPMADVMPLATYEQFLEQMSRCDLALAAFPFGNTNSTVDTSLLGLPTVVHFGPESPAQTDAMVLRTAGLPEWLVCHSDEKYYETALALINDADLRVSVTKGLDRSAIRERLFPKGQGASATVFAEMIWEMYQNHAKLSSSKQRVYRYADLVKN